MKYSLNITKINDKFYLRINNNILFNLQTGRIAFENSCSFLESIKPLFKLQFNNDLKLDVDILEECVYNEFNNDNTVDRSIYYTSHTIIEKAINMQFKNMLNNYDIIGFHYDKCIDNPELSLVLQVVDDSNSNYVRRNLIFSKKSKYIGISAIHLKQNMYCFYLIFGNNK